MAPPARDASVPGLIKSLADDVTHLFAQEIALAKTEVSSGGQGHQGGRAVAGDRPRRACSPASSCCSAPRWPALSLVMETWLAALIVGGVVAIIGVVLLLKAKKSLNPESMVPNRTIESLKKDEAMVRRTVS